MGMTFELEKVLDLKKWEKVQESIAIATQVAIILIDYKGKPVTRHSRIQPFCQLARVHPELGKFCEKCDARAGLEAVRTGEPFIYRCHFDIVDMAIPILVDGNYTGAIMAGQIKLADQQHSLEQVLTLPNQELLNQFKQKYQHYYDTYPELPLNDLKKVANMLETLSEYIVSEAIKKDYLVQAYQHTLNIVDSTSNTQSSITTETLEYVKKEVSSTLLDNRLLKFSQGDKTQNKQLQPAIDYLYQNKNELVTLKKLAHLTNLSQSHLSRPLREELGESFRSAYVKLKISWAKELLETTSLSINEISDELGYIEPSYFVRLFKQKVGYTPLNYRKAQKKD